MKVRSLVAILAALLLGLLACMQCVAAQDVTGTIRFGLSADPPTLDPHLTGGTSAITVKMTIYEGLMSYLPNGEITPQLAEAYEVVDSTTYVFHLREGVKFHNGDDFTADDVIYSFGRILDPSTGAFLKSQLAVIESIEAPDPYTIVITLKNPFAPFLEVLARQSAAILSESWMATSPDLNNTANGTGPFSFVRRIPGIEIQVERNADYYIADMPKSAGVRFMVYSDADARLSALQTNEVNIIEYVEWRQMPLVDADPTLVLDTTPGPFQILSINVDYEPFQDPRVRRAMSYAINREEIAASCFEGRAIPIYGGLTSESSWAYNEDLADYFSYDPDKAMELLAEAGYPNGFSCTLLATSAYSTHFCPAEVIQAQLALVGIDVEVELIDWPSRVESRSEWTYEFASDGLTGDYLDPDFYYRYFYGQTSPYCRPPYFDDAEVNALLDRGRETLDRDERKAIYHQLEERLLELSPWIFLVKREQGYAYRAGVEGFTQLPDFMTTQTGVVLKYVSIPD